MEGMVFEAQVPLRGTKRADLCGSALKKLPLDAR